MNNIKFSSDIDPFDFANHLTAVDWHLFSCVKPKELINKAWVGEDKCKRAPNVIALIDHFNKVILPSNY